MIENSILILLKSLLMWDSKMSQDEIKKLKSIANPTISRSLIFSDFTSIDDQIPVSVVMQQTTINSHLNKLKHTSWFTANQLVLFVFTEHCQDCKYRRHDLCIERTCRVQALANEFVECKTEHCLWDENEHGERRMVRTTGQTPEGKDERCYLTWAAVAEISCWNVSVWCILFSKWAKEALQDLAKQSACIAQPGEWHEGCVIAGENMKNDLTWKMECSGDVILQSFKSNLCAFQP